MVKKYHPETEVGITKIKNAIRNRICGLPKNKLIVVVGAGASIDFGMPSIEGAADLLSDAAQERYPLFENPETNLYRYIESTIAEYWGENALAHRGLPNFEEVLYSVFALAAAFPAGRFTSALGAFVGATPLPDVNWFGNRRQAVDSRFLRQFGHYLVDTLLDRFRDRCRSLDVNKSAELEKMRAFFTALGSEFETSIVTLNYDDIVYRTMPGLEKGFDSDGRFDDTRIMLRRNWPCILHLHGSVHFDMRDDYKDFMGFGGFHDIHWQEDLSRQFNQNASGRSSLQTVEGPDFPTSSIVAGYGKTTQLLRRPFRTYFGELDRLVAQCDAAMFVGYGFSDIHLNLAFEKFRDKRCRPVVVIDLARSTAMNAQGIEWAAGDLLPGIPSS
jgi:SIR2-like domain